MNDIVTCALTILKKIDTLERMPKVLYTTDDAIAQALKGNWKEAVAINLALLKDNKTNIDMLNRLGFAYLKTGNIPAAKKTFKKILSLDPYNQIALKNNKKTSAIASKFTQKNETITASPISFLEDPGKTKIASCVNLAPTATLSCLCPGEEVYLKAKNHSIELRLANNTYIAALPDDIAFKLKKLLLGGNRYQATVKSVEKNALLVLLRETFRAKRFAHQPSFVSTMSPSFSPLGLSTEIKEDRPSTIATGEEDTEEPEEKAEAE